MEAPEKIYFDENDIRGVLDTYQYKFPHDIFEYVRKDAFIEKACDAYCKVCGHYPHTVPTHICRHDCDYFKDFKKYVEGE